MGEKRGFTAERSGFVASFLAGFRGRRVGGRLEGDVELARERLVGRGAAEYAAVQAAEARRRRRAAERDPPRVGARRAGVPDRVHGQRRAPRSARVAGEEQNVARRAADALGEACVDAVVREHRVGAGPEVHVGVPGALEERAVRVALQRGPLRAVEQRARHIFRRPVVLFASGNHQRDPRSVADAAHAQREVPLLRAEAVGWAPPALQHMPTNAHGRRGS